MGLSRRQQRELAEELEESQERAARRGIRAGVGRVLRAVARRILGLEVSEVAEVAEAGGDALGFAAEASRGRWRDRWLASLEPVIEEAVSAASEPLMEALDEPFSLENPAMRELFSSYVVRLSEQLPQTTADDLTKVIRDAQSAGLSNPQTAARIREVMPDITQRRATLIARDQNHKVSILAQEWQMQASSVEITEREWLSAQDERVRPLHRELNGQARAFGESFAPGVFSPADEIQCRCTLLYRFSED